MNLNRNLLLSFFIIFFPSVQIFIDQMILLMFVVFFGIKYMYGKYINKLYNHMIRREINWRIQIYYLSFLSTWTSLYFIFFYGKRIKALSVISKWAGESMIFLKKNYSLIVKKRMENFGKELLATERYWLRFSQYKVSDTIDRSYLKNNIIYLIK